MLGGSGYLLTQRATDCSAAHGTGLATIGGRIRTEPLAAIPVQFGGRVARPLGLSIAHASAARRGLAATSIIPTHSGETASPIVTEGGDGPLAGPCRPRRELPFSGT